jgi:hypothetical protein
VLSRIHQCAGQRSPTNLPQHQSWAVVHLLRTHSMRAQSAPRCSRRLQALADAVMCAARAMAGLSERLACTVEAELHSDGQGVALRQRLGKCEAAFMAVAPKNKQVRGWVYGWYGAAQGARCAQCCRVILLPSTVVPCLVHLVFNTNARTWHDGKCVVCRCHCYS